jgi:hypothetical protein
LLGVLDDEIHRGVDVVAPNGVDELARLNESRPARRGVASRQNQLRVGELGRPRVDLFGVMFP